MSISKYFYYKEGDYYLGFKIIENLGSNSNGQWSAIFECHCSSPFKRTFSNLKRNTTHGCEDCLSLFLSNKTKYNVKDRRLYSIWKGMNYRCTREEYECFEHYGKRGISVSHRWSDNNKEGFNNFYKDMGIYPSNDYSIDRIDVNGNYEPSNCRWATQITQMNNTRRNHNIVYKGVCYTITELARVFDIIPNTLEYRILRGWSVEEAITGNRILPWTRPYSTTLTDEDFNQLLKDRYESNISLSKLKDKYSVDSGQLSRMFRREDVLAYYKNLEGEW